MNATAGTRWDRAPASPRASAGVVDVWRADLAAADGLAELLCAQERARAERLLRATLWARSRGMLRALLGRYLDRDPRGLRFELGPQGKPALRGRAGRARQLRFNLSHSGELALVAVTAGREVGVDVECAPRARRVHELAIVARVLGPAQARWLRELEPDARECEFLRAWTLREATAKCVGTGLASTLPPMQDGSATGLWTATLDAGPRAAAAVADPEVALWTAALDAGPRAVAAVAAEGREERELRCFQWPG